MLIALLQHNPKVGDINANVDKIFRGVIRAASIGASLVVSPELSIIGYPPRDLLLYSFIAQECYQAILALAERTRDLNLSIIVGAPAFNQSGRGKLFQNVAFVIKKGQIVAQYAKRLLPSYDVFDEARYFEPGSSPLVINHEGIRLAITICEDIWNDANYWQRPIYPIDPLENHPSYDVLVNLSASPFSVGKQAQREDMLGTLCRRYEAEAIYVNQSGANDELIFDGRSFHLDRTGRVISRAKAFNEDLSLIEIGTDQSPTNQADLSPLEEIYQALSLGISDYCRKNSYNKAVIGLSGGIDSALTAALAAQTLGPDNILGLLMPSPFSTSHSIEDANELAVNLKIRQTNILSIRAAMLTLNRTLVPCFRGLKHDTTEENIQARIRGVLLMAAANKFGSLLLNTGNKSEISVGYCTIYGDMCGALAVIGDLYKTGVYSLARYLNEKHGRALIPLRTIDKPPSAELRPNQYDRDSLPPYDILDTILKALFEDHQSPAYLEKQGFDPKVVAKVADLVRIAEFKRRQGAPVLKISSQAFGVGWRMPITCGSVFSPREKPPLT
ncbi:MAG: NAD+ synthase [Deltaproteobacteria bacterium]|jgi:NAD+ synthase/NAD+ synthase (glutamine-hydrolysing)|nr:NAD+ synthase [Deltaproteobacteria bacterium]